VVASTLPFLECFIERLKSLRALFHGATTDMKNVGDNVGDQIDSKLTERQRNILNIIKESPTISGRQMSEMLSVSQRTIEHDFSYLQNHGILKHEGSDKDGA
jgi:ATP-dependent DNA helicase RecG